MGPATARRLVIARTEYAINRGLTIGDKINGFVTKRGVTDAPEHRRERVAVCFWRAARATGASSAWRGRTDQPLSKDEA